MSETNYLTNPIQRCPQCGSPLGGVRTIMNCMEFCSVTCATLHCPQPQPESEVKTCPSSAQSTDGAASGPRVPTAPIHPEGSNAAPQGSNPPAGAAGEDACPSCGGRMTDGRCSNCFHEPKVDETATRDWLEKHHATPPTQPTGGTPEVDASSFKQVGCDGDELVHANFARTLERQRNEARAALAATQAEVERIKRPSVDEGSLGGMVIEYNDKDNRFYAYSAFGERLWSGEATFNVWQCVRLTAELEQTRRVRDSLGVGYDEMHDELYSALGMHLTCAAEIDALRQALTAAEQRADGAGIRKMLTTAVPSASLESSLVNCAEHALRELTAQRDTAIRERDAEKAMVDWLERVALTRDSQSVTLQWLNPDDHSEYIRMEITHHIPLDEFYASETLRQAIASHQQEITP